MKRRLTKLEFARLIIGATVFGMRHAATDLPGATPEFLRLHNEMLDQTLIAYDEGLPRLLEGWEKGGLLWIEGLANEKPN